MVPGKEGCADHGGDCQGSSAACASCRFNQEKPSHDATGGKEVGKRHLWFPGSLLAGLFLVCFLILDGSSTASQHWGGAPPWYLPVGLSLAVLLCADFWAVPLVFVCSILAAALNYHRPLLSWCGVPGAIGVYGGYVGSAAVLKRWWPADLRRGTLPDVGRYIIASFGGSVVSTIVGVLTLFGDGRIRQSEFFSTAADWWTSDMLAITAFTPFLVIFIAPLVRAWFLDDNLGRFSFADWGGVAAIRVAELAAKLGFVGFSIWLVFGYPPATPYQPLYLLFIPVIWAAVRGGLPRVVWTTFAIGVAMTLAAWITQAPQGSLPRLQLATLTLGMTGLCLGAVVTERKRGEQSIRDSESRYRHLFECNLAGVFRATVCGRILECNPAAAQMFGYASPKELEGVRVDQLYSSTSDWEIFLAKIKTERFITNHEVRFRRKNGEPVWAMLNVALVENEDGGEAMLEGTLVNIHERRRAEERVQSLAFYDALTTLPNRTLLLDRLRQALSGAARRNCKVAVLFLDLDGFKTINDSLGHSTGDLLLQEVACRLKSRVREQDTVARLGGDEFVIVLTDVKELSDVPIVAERFMDAMKEKFEIHGYSLRIGCSIGISIFPDHGEDTETLIKHADSAMYSAKDNGRNNFRFFTADMNKQALERLKLENALRSALFNEELFLVYQPQMDIASGRILGFEALLRWKHPELGLVPPDKFIRTAETSGLILPIGEWVLKTACSQAKRWNKEWSVAVPIAVNVSAVQFRHEKFCDRVRMVLTETGLSPEHLELELTESLLLANVEQTLAVLERLKSMGLTLAIDDFGTGYSSLSYLRRFPVSKLKIDRSFIRDLGGNPGDAAITAAIIGMAKSLHLHVVAEGVETEEQMSFLRERDCDAIQGYYFSRPLSVEELAKDLLPKMAMESEMLELGGGSEMMRGMF